MSQLRMRLKRPVLRWARWFLLVLGVGLLGLVAFSLLDAMLFQAYESRRLNQSFENSRRASAEPPSQRPRESALLPPKARRVSISTGSVLGRIEISGIGLSVVVLEGVDGKSLRRGVGHVHGTALPSDQGNVAIAGHRDTFFRPLRDIRQQDEITVTTVTGSFRYQVDSISIVAGRRHRGAQQF